MISFNTNENLVFSPLNVTKPVIVPIRVRWVFSAIRLYIWVGSLGGFRSFVEWINPAVQKRIKRGTRAASFFLKKRKRRTDTPAMPQSGARDWMVMYLVGTIPNMNEMVAHIRILR
jgi:hypothetical protein